MYFDKRTGAPHSVRRSKSFVTVLKQVFCILSSLTEEKERKKKGKQQNKTKNMHIIYVPQMYTVTSR